MANFGRIFRDFLIPVLVVILGGVVGYDHLVVPNTVAVATPLVNGKSLGRQFMGPLAGSLSDAWSVAASTLEQGKTVGDAQAALQSQWQTERAKVFATLVAPEFNKVLPEGTEPTTPAQRAEVVKLWRDFAIGLKGGR